MKRLALLAVLLFIAPALAHEAGPPRAWEKRVLHDCVDDFQGGDSVSRTGLDIHTLDIAEKYDATLGHVYAFSIVYGGGYTGGDSDTLGIQVNFGGKSYSSTTTDATTFSKGTFDKVLPTVASKDSGGQTDGQRRIFEGWVDADDFTGSTSQFSATASVGGAENDAIPGDDTGPLQDCETPFEASSYSERGTGYYADLSINSAGTIPYGTEKLLDLTLKNALSGSQTFLLDVQAPGSVTARFHGGEGYMPAPLERSLASQSQTTFHLALRADDADASGVVTVTLTSDKGGYEVVEVPFSTGSAETGGESSNTGSNTGGASPSEDSPGLGVLAPLLLLAFLARRK